MKKILLGFALFSSAILIVGCEENISQEIKEPPINPPIENIVDKTVADPNFGASVPVPDEHTNGLISEINVPKTGNETVDAEVQALITKKIQELNVVHQELVMAGREMRASLLIDGEIFDSVAGTHSLLLTVDEYAGGAHPNTHFETWTYRDSGEVLKFHSLFQTEHNPYTVIAPIAKTMITESLGEMVDPDWLERGTGEDAKNYEDFTLDGENLVLNVEPYQVAPYAAGPQIVKIPFTDLNAILAPPFLAGTEDVVIDHSEICTSSGGNWLANHNECENVGRDWCEQEMGKFNECASACRNDPEAMMCTMQCVLVCEF
ncbi:DUF3298 domain-containing protein [bacterium]|jgi:hypothetical protein|nr:DUF3298 domain-containing protein [bacterium]MBT6832251.1 DUF3298 domain-containing protein [bacterium]MBT6996188.1 DUF3298 domain-containing protein [bacterium]MBT7772435.1 DUF3298 domain-containing protein [bacterium]